MYDGSEPHSIRLDVPRAPTQSLAERVRRPIFLHGLWRSGSTYLWSRFRRLETARCFYEPLHHGLSRLSLARIVRDTPEKIGGNRHPALADPYFLEFAPLVGGRGVKFYREDLAYDRYALRPNEAHPRLGRYVENLIDHADGEGRSAVLGFNRTGLRIAWLKARFPEAVNVHIDRDPAAIWASYAAETAKGNYAFFSMWFRVLMNNAEHPVLAPLVERLGLYRRAALLHGPPKAVHRQLVETMSAAETYYMVYYLWLACTAHAHAECDLVIDTRRAGGASYRREVEGQIAALTGFSIDLSDMRAAAARLEPPATLRARIEASAEACLPYGALPKTPVFPQRSPQGPILQRLDLLKAA